MARTSTSCPRRAASVATRLRLPAGTGEPPVVRLRNWTDASSARTSLTSRAAGRACRPCGFSTEKTPTISSVPTSLASVVVARVWRRQVPGLAHECVPRFGRDLGPAGSAGGGNGSNDEALDEGCGRERDSFADRGSWSRSSASSALRTALPRSMSTTTPAGPSACSMACMIATASVPKVVSSSPAATSIRRGRPCSISAARATAERASVRLWETTTSPTAGRTSESGVSRKALCHVQCAPLASH